MRSTTRVTAAALILSGVGTAQAQETLQERMQAVCDDLTNIDTLTASFVGIEVDRTVLVVAWSAGFIDATCRGYEDEGYPLEEALVLRCEALNGAIRAAVTAAVR